MIPADFITLDRWKIDRTIDLGYRKVEKPKKEIRNFLRKEKNDGKTSHQL